MWNLPIEIIGTAQNTAKLTVIRHPEIYAAAVWISFDVIWKIRSYTFSSPCNNIVALSSYSTPETFIAGFLKRKGAIVIEVRMAPDGAEMDISSPEVIIKRRSTTRDAMRCVWELWRFWRTHHDVVGFPAHRCLLATSTRRRQVSSFLLVLARFFALFELAYIAFNI